MASGPTLLHSWVPHLRDSACCRSLGQRTDRPVVSSCKEMVILRVRQSCVVWTFGPRQVQEKTTSENRIERLKTKTGRAAP